VLVAGAGASLAAAPTVTPAPSELAVVKALTAALSLTHLPQTLTPTLQQLTDDPYAQEGTITYVNPSCDPYTYPSEASDPKPCWWGATKKTDPVLAIWGDSFVGNWMPALDAAAKSLGYRVAVFEFKGCFTAFTPSSTEPGFGQDLVAACNTWHTTLPAAVLRLHPKVLIAANGTPVYRVTSAAWLQGMQLAFHKLNPKGTSTEILIGTGVHLNSPAPQCLSANMSSVQACTLTYTSTSETEQGFSRDAMVASHIPHVHLMTTYQWVCRNDACPVVVGHLIVYADWQHLTIAYSAYLSHVFYESLRSILVPARTAAAGTG